MPSIRDIFRILPGDLVRTKTGRQGVVKGVSANETAIVRWEDGEEFAIRFAHLEVLAHNCELPVRAEGARKRRTKDQ